MDKGNASAVPRTQLVRTTRMNAECFHSCPVIRPNLKTGNLPQYHRRHSLQFPRDPLVHFSWNVCVFLHHHRHDLSSSRALRLFSIVSLAISFLRCLRRCPEFPLVHPVKNTTEINLSSLSTELTTAAVEIPAVEDWISYFSIGYRTARSHSAVCDILFPIFP